MKSKALSAKMEWALREGWREDGTMRVVIGRHGIAHSTVAALKSRGLVTRKGTLTAAGFAKRRALVDTVHAGMEALRQPERDDSGRAK